MAEEVEKFDVSKAAKAIGATPDITETLARSESVSAPYRAQKQRMERESAEFGAEKAIQELKGKVGEAEARSKALKEQRESLYSSPEFTDSQKAAEAFMKAGQFVPTKETAGDFAQVFALINIAGFALGAGGKKNAQAAMSGMNGMMEGYQKGRADLYKKERDQFLTNLKALENNYKVTRERLNDLIKRSDMSLAEKTAAAEVEALRSNADFLKNNISRSGLAASIKTMDEIIGRIDGISDWVMQKKQKEDESLLRQRQAIELERVKSGLRAGERAAEVDLLERKQAAKLGTAGPAAAIYRATGKVLPSPKEAASVISTSQALREIVGLRERLKDPEIQTGLLSYPAPLLQKVKSLFGQSLSEGDVRSFVDQNLTSNDKTTLFIKDAILAGFKVEQGLTGTRVPVFTQKVVGPILDPRNYKPETYDKLLATREKELYGTGEDYGFDKNEMDAIARTASARAAVSLGGGQQIPQAAIDALKNGTGTKEQFDAVFGAGAAARVLGGK